MEEKKIMVSAQLAMDQARREITLEQLKKIGAPEAIIQIEKETLERIKEEVAHDIIASEILDQARAQALAIARRKQAIEESHLGELIRAFDELWVQVFQSQSLEGVNTASPFSDKLDTEFWNEFITGLASGNMAEIVNPIVRLLRACVSELTFQEFPPVPPQIVIKEKRYSPKDIN